MIIFDHDHSTLIFRNIALGSETSIDDIRSISNSTERQEYIGKDFSIITIRTSELNLKANFQNEKLKNGYFWSSLDESQSWDDSETDEIRRRSIHETIMLHLFGQMSYSDKFIEINLASDRKTCLEIIEFIIK